MALSVAFTLMHSGILLPLLAQELEAKTLLLQSQLDYVQAADEMKQAIGRTPE